MKWLLALALIVQQLGGFVRTETTDWNPCDPSNVQSRLEVWTQEIVASDVPIGPITDRRMGQRPCVYQEPLFQETNFTYTGSFRVPYGTGLNSFEAGGTALAYSLANDSLFLVGHPWYQRVAELQIPEIRQASTLNGLARAVVRQPLTDVLRGHLGDIGYGPRIGGILPRGSDLIVSGYLFYNALNSQTKSHFGVRADFAQTSVLGPFTVSNALGLSGYVGGYMLTIPTRYQQAFGGPAFTGQSNLNIISTTSTGPTLTVFDPAQFGVTNPVPGVTVLGYPLSHDTLQLGRTASVGGGVWPDGYRSVLFAVRLGTKPECYGTGTSSPALHGTRVPNTTADVYCYDPVYASKGYHGYPYRSVVLAYDSDDLLKVKAGTVTPWQVKPYAQWPLTVPFAWAGAQMQGFAYDPVHHRIFVTNDHGDGSQPAVHVFEVTP